MYPMTLSPSALEPRWDRLALVACAFSVAKILSLVDRRMVIMSPLPEFKSCDEVVGVGAIHLLSTAVLVRTMQHALAAIPAKPAFGCLFVLFHAASIVYGLSDGQTPIAIARTVMGFAALGMWASASLAVGEIPHLFERPRILSDIGALVGILLLLGSLVDDLFLNAISKGYNGKEMVGKWALVVFPISVLGARHLSNHVVEQKYNPFHLPKDVIGLTAIATFLATNVWMGAVIPMGDIRVSLNLGFCCLILGMIATYTIYQQSAVNGVISPRMLGSESNDIISALAVLLFNGVYYLPLWLRARGQSESLSDLFVLPFMISAVLSLVILGRLQNPFRMIPLVFAVIAPLLSAMIFYSERGQLQTCGFVASQIIYGASTGAGIWFSLVIGQTTEFLANIGGFVEAARE
ncbi:hypothetical protein C8R45DRAFT_1185973 [Mycena sanguinolenta]|nr:hypothetical protein C8R45DRAFT_1185973 [Mycena sanguinolenta]